MAKQRENKRCSPDLKCNPGILHAVLNVTNINLTIGLKPEPYESKAGAARIMF